MKNNREYNRYSVKCSGDITDSRHNNYKFVMNNISAGGMSITTDEEMIEENELTILFDMCDIMLPRTKQLKGRIVRKKADDPVYNYGIRFTDVTSMEVVEMDEYLRFRHYSALVHMVDNPVEGTYMR